MASNFAKDGPRNLDNTSRTRLVEELTDVFHAYCHSAPALDLAEKGGRHTQARDPGTGLRWSTARFSSATHGTRVRDYFQLVVG